MAAEEANPKHQGLMHILLALGNYFYDKLQCRLERMERRLSVLKQREESHERPAEVLPRATALPLVKTHKSTNEVSRIELKKRRRHSHLTSRKRHKGSSFVERPHVGATRSNGLQEGSDSDDEENDDTSEDSSSVGGEEEEEAESGSELISDSGRNQDSDNKEEATRQPSPLIKEKLVDYPIMQTEVMYHLYYPRHVCPGSPDAKRIQEQLEVETPSWRLKPLTNMYQLEGTENITDEAYNKRHLKFEQEEKRRKRWDLQRLRDLRMLEKLEKQKEEELRASQDEADMETFLPSVQDLRHIEITESVPVMAFGQPLPYTCPAEFELTWDMNSSIPSTSSMARLKPSGSGSSRKH